MDGTLLAQTEISLWRIAGVVDFLLSWVGLGCLVGLAVSAVLSPRQIGGVATVVIAIVGALLGCGLLQYFNPGQNIRPLSQVGFVVGVTGSLVLLLFFGLLGGFYVSSDSESPRRSRRRRIARHYLQED
jgi:uncharacterized membrane protein YeaQ/YmgE (transglycosylase-associated protein family)